jgi:hypothetical protein
MNYGRVSKNIRAFAIINARYDPSTDQKTFRHDFSSSPDIGAGSTASNPHHISILSPVSTAAIFEFCHSKLTGSMKSQREYLHPVYLKFKFDLPALIRHIRAVNKCARAAAKRILTLLAMCRAPQPIAIRLSKKITGIMRAAHFERRISAHAFCQNGTAS